MPEESSENGQADVEVSPDMIEAGVSYYMAWIGEEDQVCSAVTEREFVEGLYRNMAAKLARGTRL